MKYARWQETLKDNPTFLKITLPYTDTNEVPIYHLVADVENIIQTNRVEEVQERNRCAVANQIQNFLHAEKKKDKRDPVTIFYRSATKATRVFLKQHPELIVIEADKGNKTVVMQREEYDGKLQRMIDDDNTYKKLTRDPTSSYQKRNNEFAKRLADLKLIDRATEMKLKTYRAISPRIYGAPKAHKEGLPLRPVVPCMTSPSYTLSQFVGKIIQKTIAGRYNVTNSFSFCQYIKSIQLPPGYVLISLDVVSLFTSIPKDLVLRDVINNWVNIKQNTDINLDLFLEITEFCIDCSYFQFKGQFFQQVFGTAMGNPLSPTIADLVMETLMDTVTKRISFPIPVLKKYVDDLILSVPQEKIDEVIEIFNQYHLKIQFTVEVEKDGRIPF
ncbi:uncharacterized protein LOC134206504 [Armigeres subalbatus]|uniref:uncharacterized protein LOC134206504 n=1 Tax=Armigeres subalbatus TaxID=124917 RepID=UPI002ED2DD24